MKNMTDIKKKIEDFLNHQMRDFEIAGIKMNYPPNWFLILLGLFGLIFTFIVYTMRN